MPKFPAATLSALADLRPADDTATGIRDAIARASGKRAAAVARSNALAASGPRLTLETDDDAQLDRVEAEVRSADRDVARIAALIGELRVRLVPAQHEETAQRLAVQARPASDEREACRMWMAEAVPAIARHLPEGARRRMDARIAHQSCDRALRASGLRIELAAALPIVAPTLSALKTDRAALSADWAARGCATHA